MRGGKPGVEETQMKLKFRFRIVSVCIIVRDAALCSTITIETGLPRDY